MTVATINRYIQLFSDSFEALSAPVSMAEAERLAMVVHRSMSATTRAYHDARHVLYVSQDADAVQTLAALFHDTVYWQLDRGLASHVAGLIADVVEVDMGTLRLCQAAADDADLAINSAVFGFTPGQVLPPFGGMNEFLSAVLATRLLRPHVSTLHLIAVAACIEATIPFRAADAQGRSAAQRLAGRVLALLETRADLVPGKDAQARANAIVRTAVGLANRDVGSFAEPDPGVFLSSTWQLIEETNAPLNAVGVYSFLEYREALMRMDGFLSRLDPSLVFQDFDGHLGPQISGQLQAAAARNVRFAVDYLRAKIATMAILEACALCTGGNCPISMLLGDIHSFDDQPPDRVEDFLPAVAQHPDAHSGLLQVLERGRATASSNDLTHSPLTAFVYRCLGHDGTQGLMDSARQMYADQLAPLDFLKATNRGMVLEIIRACARIAVSRAAALKALEHDL